jgi:cytochrome c2
MLAAQAVMILLTAAAQAGDMAGERLFQRCYACHSVKPQEQDLPGPNLHGIVGRAAGADRNFQYSPALRARADEGLVWTEAELGRFITDPEAMIPHNAMNFAGLKSAEDRGALIEYLKRAE